MTDRGDSKRGYCGQGNSSVNRRVAAKRLPGVLEMPLIHRRPAIFGSIPCQRLVHDISTVEPPRGRIGGTGRPQTGCGVDWNRICCFCTR